MNRLRASLINGYPPFAVADSWYPFRSGAAVYGVMPQLAVYGSVVNAVYQNLSGVWVSALSTDQLTTLGAETVLFNQSGGNVVLTYDEATGSQYYVMSLRDDGLSWLSAPSPSTNPSALPQVIVLRRRDSAGNSLPFVKASGAELSGTCWENVIFVDVPSYGNIAIKVLPQGQVVLTVGNSLYYSNDNGSNFYTQGAALVNSLTNMTSGIGAATGGTQNP